jgi:hypothetical protein
VSRFRIEYNSEGRIGKWYVWAGVKQYLWPDLSIRSYLIDDVQRHGFFRTREDAAMAINQFVRSGGLNSMCNLASLPAHVVQGVYEVLNDWHPKGKSFTAHDLTVELRNRCGPKTPVLHGHVRDVVHELFRQGSEPFVQGYQATMATHLNPANPPLLYHPAGSGVSNYTPHSSVPAPRASAPPLANHVPWRAEGRCTGIVRG